MQPKILEIEQEGQGQPDVVKCGQILAAALEWAETSGFFTGAGIPASVGHTEITLQKDSKNEPAYV